MNNPTIAPSDKQKGRFFSEPCPPTMPAPNSPPDRFNKIQAAKVPILPNVPPGKTPTTTPEPILR